MKKTIATENTKTVLGKPARLLLLLFAICLLGTPGAQAFPGVMVDSMSLTYDWYSSTPREFISDPAIAVLANGDYLALHAYAGRKTSDYNKNNTEVFISTDKGQNWSHITTLNNIFTASIFQKSNGDVYLFGVTESGGKEIVCKSTDGGYNWTYGSPFSYQCHFTPARPFIHNGRIFDGANTRAMSADENSDWMLEASWTVGQGYPAPKSSWLTGTAEIQEGQVVPLPGKGIFLLPKVKDYSYTPIARCGESGSSWACFDPAHNYVPLPGGDKKFGAAYDPTSGKAFIVSNPVLPAYPNSEPPNMVRNTGAILSSRDMLNWKVEKLYVFSSNWDVDGFAYANLDFDGNDMVVATRTAFPLNGGGSGDPRRGHDSNCLGFFSVSGFRNLVPDQYLKIESGSINRYEHTQYQDAPLGQFQLGISLNSPDSLGQAANGDIYVHDATGIRHFDASGNYFGIVASAPVSLQPTQIDVVPPSDGACTWLKSGSGDWTDPLNWHYWNRADTPEDIAVFGSAATAPTTVDFPSDARKWFFETDGDFEGWSTNHMGATVSGGVLQGTPDTGDPQLYRLDQSFFADDVSDIVVRMKVGVASAKVGIFWGTGTEIAFAADKHIQATYTGNGEFQDVVLHMAGHAKWDGQVIARVRIDPLDDGKTNPLEIDSISFVKDSSVHLKGLRFISDQPYTLSGGGALTIEADSGPGLIDVQKGAHNLDLPVTLASDAGFHVETGTSLRIPNKLDLAGNALEVEGNGQLVVDNGEFQMDSGSLTIGEGSSMLFSNTVFQFNGTVEFAAPQNFHPSAGDTFHVIEGNASEGMFSQLVFPTLEDGLGWDTSALYTTGDISVILKVPESWMAQYGLPTDGSGDFADTDGDGYDNYSEWKTGTNPTNALSFFDFDPSGTMPVPNGVQLRWNSLTGRTYRIELSTNLLDSPAFTVLQSGIPGVQGALDFLDTGATNREQSYYRVYAE